MRNIEMLRNVASKHFVSFLPISVHVNQMHSLPVMKQLYNLRSTFKNKYSLVVKGCPLSHYVLPDKVV